MGRAYAGQVVGLFDHHEDDPDGLEALAERFTADARRFAALGESTRTAVGAAQAQVGGELVDPVGNVTLPVERDTEDLHAASTRAAAAIRIWGSSVRSFNAKVDELNDEYATAAGNDFGLRKPDDPTADAANAWEAALDQAQSALVARLKKDYASQEAVLDSLAGYAASVLEGDAPVPDTPTSQFDGLIEWLKDIVQKVKEWIIRHKDLFDAIGDLLVGFATILTVIGLAVAFFAAALGISALATLGPILGGIIVAISVIALVFHVLAAIGGDKDALKDLILDIIGLIPVLGKLPKIAKYIDDIFRYLDDAVRYFDDIVKKSREFVEAVYEFVVFGLQDAIDSIVCWILGLFGHDCHQHPKEA